MQTYNELKTEYTRQVEMTEQALTRVQGRINLISLLRVLLFCMAVAGVFYFWNEGWALMAGTLVLTLLPFLMLIRYHNRLFWRKEYLEKERETSLQELAALDNASMPRISILTTWTCSARTPCSSASTVPVRPLARTYWRIG